MKRFDPIVIDREDVTLQRLLDAVVHGYSHHTAGHVPIHRAQRFVQRMANLYFVGEDRHAKRRARAAGRGNAILLLSQQGESAEISFWLLVTPPEAGVHPAHNLEQLLDARTAAGRIVLRSYELVRQVRGGQLRPSWTWRFKADKYQAWRTSIVDAVRHTGSGKTIRELMCTLFATSPGFAGARQQVGKLAALYRSEWRRRRPSEPIETIPVRLRYVRRLATSGKRLQSIVANSSSGQGPQHGTMHNVT